MSIRETPVKPAEVMGLVCLPGRLRLAEEEAGCSQERAQVNGGCHLQGESERGCKRRQVMILTRWLWMRRRSKPCRAQVGTATLLLTTRCGVQGSSSECAAAASCVLPAGWHSHSSRLRRRKLVNGTYTTPAVQVAVKHDNVAGVALPRFRVIRGELEARADLGLAGGGRDIARAQRQWSSLLTLLVRLAGLQTQFQALDKAIKLTSRRVNALENVRPPSANAAFQAHLPLSCTGDSLRRCSSHASRRQSSMSSRSWMKWSARTSTESRRCWR